MLAALRKGDTVVTQGGIIGKVFKLADDEITVDTGEGGKLRIVRSMIVDVRNTSAPAPANDAKES
jgi:preprotein translocase subunit YajC